VRRLPKRAVYDRAQIDAILDAGTVCHVGFVADGQPYVLPTGYVRSGDQIYFHGSAASRMLRTLASGLDVCVTVTLLDGLVLARSAFHHSVNYRSVVILGKARLVTDAAERVAELDEVSAKVRQGPPVDDEEDYALPVWAGVVPVRLSLGQPVPDERIRPDAPALDVRRFACFQKDAS
jgi:hypothetical protein